MHIFADIAIVFACSSYFYIKFISLWLEEMWSDRWVRYEKHVIRYW